MTDFEAILKTLPEYKNLLIQHGERLFIQRDGEYEILTVRLAYKFHHLATMTHVVIPDDGVLKPDGSLMNTGRIIACDSYAPIKSR
ncbi:hypothetical protein ACVBEE_00525 [Acinetobacter sp. ANC 3781]